MNKIDFSFTGGFPLDQEVLDFMQNSCREIFGGIFGDAGNTPVIIAGMEQINPFIGSINDGLFYYQGEIYKFVGGPFPGLFVGSDYAIVLNQSTTSAVFEDASSHPIYVTRTASLAAVSTGTPGTIWLSSLVRWHKPFGDKARGDWFEIDVATSSSSPYGTIFYRKNILTNTLQVFGTINIPAGVSDPPLYYVFGNLPAAYRPGTTVPFTLYRRYHSGMIQDVGGVGNINQLNGEIANSGNIAIGAIKSSAGAYSVSFNTIIPLD